MSVKRLRIHVPVANRGQRLDAEEEAIEEPIGARSPGDAIWVDTIKNGKEKVQADVNSADKESELWPAQTEQPAINVAPFPRVGIDLDEFDLTGPNRYFVAPASPMANFFVHEPNVAMWPFKKMKLARPDEFPAVIDAIRDRLKTHGFTSEADRLQEILEGVWTTSNELYGELRLALKETKNKRRGLPSDVADEIRRIIKSIDHICRWR